LFYAGLQSLKKKEKGGRGDGRTHTAFSILVFWRRGEKKKKEEGQGLGNVIIQLVSQRFPSGEKGEKGKKKQWGERGGREKKKGSKGKKKKKPKRGGKGNQRIHDHRFPFKPSITSAGKEEKKGTRGRGGEEGGGDPDANKS